MGWDGVYACVGVDYPDFGDYCGITWGPLSHFMITLSSSDISLLVPRGRSIWR